MIQPIFFGLVMALALYFGQTFSANRTRYYVHLVSFSAGVSITYLFLELLPNFALSVQNRFLFLSLLVGFIMIHLVEKYIYTRAPRRLRKKELAIEDSVISFIYHFAIGIIIASFTFFSFTRAFLFFIPVLLYTTLDTLPVEASRHVWVKIILSSSTLLGIIYRTYVHHMSLLTETIILGLVIGIIAFSVIRHSIPHGRHGRPLWFLAGAVFYTLVLILFG
ncbi:hypothetical protein JW968_00785 [Candidatus Woesearchaeota archaeon]|nr:hypothetical protein [Candidatus Woesearchaeota archaeon]